MNHGADRGADRGTSSGFDDDPHRRARQPIDRPLDDVDDRIERLERRRARARTRRLLAAWMLVVLVLTVAAGAVGWHLGLPG